MTVLSWSFFSILAIIFNFKNDFAATFNEKDQRNTPNFKGSRLATNFGHVKLFSSDDFIICDVMKWAPPKKQLFALFFHIFAFLNVHNFPIF